MIKKIITFSSFLLVLFLPLIIFLISARQDLSQEMLVMGTVCRISIITEKKFTPAQADQALNQAFALLKDYERRWNFYAKDSELALINSQAAEETVKLLPDTFEIIAKALALSELTKGAFDITATSLHEEGGYGTIVLEPKAKSVSFTDAKTKIDLGGIATGYAIDKVVGVFKANNVKNYLIDVGGDIYASGRNKKNQTWGIGVRSPFNQEVVVEKIFLNNQAVTTSGNYVKKHIIDPATSVLADKNIDSVTVVAPSCLEADALATAFFIMGIDQTKAFIDQYAKNIQVLFLKNVNNKSEIVKYNWQKD
ncbi:MAG: FAD:protein FMN transferase [Candidatus Omnitrophota bacterium]